MNIALVTHDLHEHGGHSLYSRRLADALSRQNEVTVFANRCERSSDDSWKFIQVPAWRRSALATVATTGDIRPFAILAGAASNHTFWL